MAVFVFSTGSILKQYNVDAQIHISVNNRTTSKQKGRIIIWDTSSIDGPKVALFEKKFKIEGNHTKVVSYTIPEYFNVDRYEVEIRLSNPHMAPYIQQKYTSQLQGAEFKEALYAGELFHDSTENENV
ncbi:hypothetical protein [Paenibacillus koleovorans]|uniref:hypothetical protein n=1 Tax=Paenibacillus koleovorans TaxID=121608 RepID=UPI000FD71DC6|nr:hypothetical protein [Paenibacillus koleovorans]